MFDQPSVVVIKRIKEGTEKESVRSYLDKDYTIDSIIRLEAFGDGTVGVRIKLTLNPIVLNRSVASIYE